MWMTSKIGFYSVVAHRDLPDMVLIRARARADLEALRTFAADVCDVALEPVLTTPAHDYGFRLLAEKEAWTTIAGALAGAIDYSNFKAAVHGEPARDKAYLRCWTAMQQMQAEMAEPATAPMDLPDEYVDAKYVGTIRASAYRVLDELVEEGDDLEEEFERRFNLTPAEARMLIREWRERRGS